MLAEYRHANPVEFAVDAYDIRQPLPANRVESLRPEAARQALAAAVDAEAPAARVAVAAVAKWGQRSAAAAAAAQA